MWCCSQAEQLEHSLALDTEAFDIAQQNVVSLEAAIKMAKIEQEALLLQKQEKTTASIKAREMRNEVQSVRQAVSQLVALAPSPWHPVPGAKVRSKSFKAVAWEVILQRESVEQLFALPLRQRKLCLKSLLELASGTQHAGLCHPIELSSNAKKTQPQTPGFDDMSIKKLKAYVTEHGGDTSNCLEKRDLVKRAESVAPPSLLKEEAQATAPLKLRMAAAAGPLSSVAFIWEESIDYRCLPAQCMLLPDSVVYAV